MRKSAFLFLSLSMFLFFAVGIFAQDMKADAAKIYNQGYSKSQSGDYKGALTDFESALKIQKDYRIYYQMGIAQARLNDFNDAITDFQNTLNANPKFNAPYNDIGNAYFALGKYQDAIDSYQKVLSTSNDEKLKNDVKFNIALAYTKLGNAAEMSKNNKQAIDYLLKAVSFNNYDAAYMFLAENYALTGQNDQAITAAQNALKYKKNIKPAGPYYWMGIAYKNKGEKAKAKEMLKKAELDPVYKTLVASVMKSMK